jgi:hypothetical protein
MVKPLKITLRQFLQGSDNFLDGQPFWPWQIEPDKDFYRVFSPDNYFTPGVFKLDYLV